jgi:hypothetical protein
MDSEILQISQILDEKISKMEAINLKIQNFSDNLLLIVGEEKFNE